jgi:hypothetical protein
MNAIEFSDAIEDAAMRRFRMQQAAPDLVEALQELLKIRSGRTVKMAKDALRKALGEGEA